MILSDAFLEERLNPLLLDTMRGYWNSLEEAKEADPDQVKLAQLNLLKYLFQKLFLKEYNAIHPKISGPVYLLAIIHTDGVGDFYSLLKCAKKFKARHPEADVHIAYTYKQELPKIDPAEFGLTAASIHPFFEKTEQEAIEELRPELEKAAVIINIALAWNTFDDPNFSPKSFYFSETGNFQGIGNTLQRNWYSMGLLPFEDGIFLEKSYPDKSPWKNSALQKLFQKPLKPYIGYLSKIPEQLLLYVYVVITLNKDSKEDIEIVIPKFLRDNNLSMDIEWIQQQGIKSISNLTADKEDILFESDLSSGKKLKLIPALPCDGADFEKMTQLAQPLLGCTGDGSLSDCLIAGKIPFYELRPHKVETMQAFQEISNYMRFQDLSDYFNALIAYKEKSLTDVAEKISKIIQRPNFNTQWISLNEFIHLYANFEEHFNGILNRFFYQQQNPKAIELEDELIQEFYSKKINGFEVAEALKRSF